METEVRRAPEDLEFGHQAHVERDKAPAMGGRERRSGRTVRCEAPRCGAEIPLLRLMWLSKRTGRKHALRVKIILLESAN